MEDKDKKISELEDKIKYMEGYIETVETARNELEQECEQLKKNVEHWKMEHKEVKAKAEWTYDLVKKRLGQQLDQLKAENEELKETLQLEEDWHKMSDKITHINHEYTRKLKQALDEIYRIIVKLLIMKDIKHLSKELNEILVIINKAKDGE